MGRELRVRWTEQQGGGSYGRFGHLHSFVVVERQIIAMVLVDTNKFVNKFVEVPYYSLTVVK
jgi:hypothetical protein